MRMTKKQLAIETMESRITLLRSRFSDSPIYRGEIAGLNYGIGIIMAAMKGKPLNPDDV